MSKMKTKSGAKKRFRMTGSGKVRMNNAFMRHMQTNKPQKMKRKARGTSSCATPTPASLRFTCPTTVSSAASPRLRALPRPRRRLREVTENGTS